jgi:hypothetical protein
MKIPTLALAAMAAIATILGDADFVARKEQTMGTQSARVQDGKAFHIFNPETMAKPTAG